MLSFFVSYQTEVFTRGGIMEKIVYLKLLQIVLTLAFISQLISLRQFCGTFADPKAFIHDISIGHCKSFTLIGKESKSGEFDAVFDQDKWHNQLLMSSTNGRPTEEQQHQFMDEMAAKLPSAGRHCIPITTSPADWFFDLIGMHRNPLKKLTLFYFSDQMFVALCSFFVCYVDLIDLLLFSGEEYELTAYWVAFASIFCWCCCAEYSFRLLLHWTDFWTCVNFQADHTNVPLINLVLSIIMGCLYVFEIFLQDPE